jgi:CHAT domain-containing protein
MPGANLLHFAVHAVIDERRPEHSRLSLAGATGSSGDLDSKSIAGLDLSRSQLVVLAACSTSSGGEVPLEGVLDLARPFLAAGAPAVITTLWDIEDRSASRFFIRFYRSLAISRDPAAALRATQLALLRSHRSQEVRLASWAGYQLVGISKLHNTEENLE